MLENTSTVGPNFLDDWKPTMSGKGLLLRCGLSIQYLFEHYYLVLCYAVDPAKPKNSGPTGHLHRYPRLRDTSGHYRHAGWPMSPKANLLLECLDVEAQLHIHGVLEHRHH